jgi:ribosomal protein S18 acetylase RimI-like enzyme
MIIRKAKKGDESQLADLYLEFWKVHRSHPLHQPHFKVNHKNCMQDMKETITDKEYQMYVALEDNKIVGFILFTIKKLSKFYKVRKYGYIEESCVDIKHRRKGIATRLGKFAINYLKKKGIKYVSCTVEKDNPIALAVWEKFGFKQTNTDLLMEI